MPHPLLIFSQSDYWIKIVDRNSHTDWQTVQIQISWLFQKPTDLDLHCLQRQGISEFSRTRVNDIRLSYFPNSYILGLHWNNLTEAILVIARKNSVHNYENNENCLNTVVLYIYAYIIATKPN